MIIQWGVMHRNGEFWRGPMSEEDARRWVREFEADGGTPGGFVVVRRAVSEWTESSDRQT